MRRIIIETSDDDVYGHEWGADLVPALTEAIIGQHIFADVKITEPEGATYE